MVDETRLNLTTRIHTSLCSRPLSLLFATTGGPRASAPGPFASRMSVVRAQQDRRGEEDRRGGWGERRSLRWSVLEERRSLTPAESYEACVSRDGAWRLVQTHLAERDLVRLGEKGERDQVTPTSPSPHGSYLYSTAPDQMPSLADTDPNSTRRRRDTPRSRRPNGLPCQAPKTPWGYPTVRKSRSGRKRFRRYLTRAPVRA